MAKFSELFPWLRISFPPAEARGFQPSEVSEDVSLVHQVYQGTHILDRALSHNVNGTLGATSVLTPVVPVGKFWYVVACSALHNDAVARQLQISIIGTTAWGIASEPAVFLTNQALTVPRAFIVPTHQGLRADVFPAITGGTRVTIRALFFEIDLGLPAIPSP